MQRRWWWAVALACALASGWVAAATPAARAACSAGSITRVVNGKTACVAGSAFRVARAPASPGVTAFHDGILERPIGLREKNGKAVPNVISPKLAAKAQVAYVAAEKKVIAAIRAKFGPRKPSAVTARADDGIGVSTTKLPDGSVSGTITKTVAVDNQSLTMEVEIGARRQGDDFKLDIGIKATVDDGNGTTTSRGIRLRDLDHKPTPVCPTATGAIELDSHAGFAQTSSDTYGSKRAHLGIVRESMSIDLKANTKGQMGPDARLQPFTVSADVRFDWSRSAAALAFFGNRARAVGTGRLTATVNPTTGALSGASVSTKAKTSGYGSDTAKADATFTAMLEKLLKDQAAGQLKTMKAIETKAREGGCTQIVFVPGSPAKLAPNASKNVAVELETAPGKVTVQTVRWAAVAAKGSASPGSSTTARPTLAVKGASKGPQTAVVNVRAVSPAGISKGSWVGQSEELAFPLAYRGTVVQSTDLPGGITEKWAATVAYKRTEQKTNPDGTKQAWYDLVAASVASHAGSGICSWSTSDAGPTIKAGDIEIRVDKAGKWTSGFLVDLQLKKASILCPPAPAAPFTPKSFFQSRAGTSLRPMTAKGPIEASNLTVGPLKATASWKLMPGD
jgi:hypothetical protein